MVRQKDYYGFIYKWIDATNGKTYVGSHKGLIKDKYKGSGKLFKWAYNKRPNKFSREILEYVYKDNRDVLLEVEQKYLDLTDWTNTYNISHSARGGSYVHTKENRQKISERMKGNTHGEGCKGKIVSEETKLKQRGNKNGGGNKGKTHTDDHRRRNSEAHKGYKQSKEHKRKRSEKLKGEFWSPARRAAYEKRYVK